MSREVEKWECSAYVRVSCLVDADTAYLARQEASRLFSNKYDKSVSEQDISVTVAPEEQPEEK